MEMVQFTSNSEEIRYYAEKCLEDGAVHTLQDIKAYVTRYAPNGGSFTQGMFAGAINSLVSNSRGKYVNVARGKYQKNVAQQNETVYSVENASSVQEENRLKEGVMSALEKACAELERACTISLIGRPSDSELMIADKVEAVIRELSRAKTEIGQI